MVGHVVPFRSTEFIDDQACDSKATNELRSREGGWAFGQIADMQTWWNSLCKPQWRRSTSPDTAGGNRGQVLNLPSHRKSLPKLPRMSRPCASSSRQLPGEFPAKGATRRGSPAWCGKSRPNGITFGACKRSLSCLSSSASRDKAAQPEERQDLIRYLALHPKAGDLMEGTGGVQPRWRRGDHGGKSGGGAIYYL